MCSGGVEPPASTSARWCSIQLSYKHRGVSERPTGVEPATGGLEGRCSSIELRTRIGGPTWTRTRNNAFGERRLDQLKRSARKWDARESNAHG